MNIILDTNAYSDYVRGDQTIADQLNRADMVYVPVIVLGELKRGFYYGSRVKENLLNLNTFLAKPRTQVLDITDKTAEQYALLAAYLKQQATPIPINDIWIAALCVQHDAPLLTRDSDFQRVPQITVLTA